VGGGYKREGGRVGWGELGGGGGVEVRIDLKIDEGSRCEVGGTGKGEVGSGR